MKHYIIQLVAVRRCFCFNAWHTRRTPRVQCAAQSANAQHTRWTPRFQTTNIVQSNAWSRKRKDCLRHYAKSAFLSTDCEVGENHPVRRTPSGTSIVHASPTTTTCDLTWLRWVKMESQYIRKEAKRQTFVADATRFGPCRICCRAQDMKSPSRWTHARARACVVVCVVCICVCPRLPGAGGGRAGEGCFRDTPGTPPGHPRDTPGTPPGHPPGSKPHTLGALSVDFLDSATLQAP